jgi:hypothetical protein
MPKLAVRIIHGMGKQEVGYSIPMQDLIKGFLQKSGKNSNDILWWVLNCDFLILARFLITRVPITFMFQNYQSDNFC